MVLVRVLERGIVGLVIVLGLISWMLYARVVRGAVLTLRTSELVTATTGLGASTPRILFVHVLPNVAAAAMSLMAVTFAALMLAEASLSFIGFGVQPPQISLGAILSSGPRLPVDELVGLHLLGPVPAARRAQHQPHRQLAAPGHRSPHRPDRVMSPALLEVRGLQVAFQRRHDDEPVVPVIDVSFDMRPGERVGLVGESGSGKSLTALAVMGLIGRIGGELGPRTSISLSGEDLLAKSERDMRWIRGGRIAMIFQDPLSSLNPVLKTGRQVIEALELHRPDLGRQQMRDIAVELLDQVHLPRPERLMDSYPHELSGGMRQRVMIAIALAGDPDLLIADEPTTALDVTIQAEVLDLLHELGEARDLAVLLITHDLSIIAGFTHRVLVMYGGRLVELAPTSDLYAQPRHPYTGLLLRSIPPLDRTEERLVAIAGSPPEPAERPDGCGFNPRCPFSVDPVCTTEPPPLVTLDGPAGASRATACARTEEIDLASLAPAPAPAAAAAGTAVDAGVLVDVERLSKTFRIKGEGLVGHELITAVDGVSLQLRRGEVLGIVGESGSGKSTLARCMLHLIEPSSGSVRFDGQDLGGLGVRRLRRLRLRMQMIFQDPASSLDPRMRVGRILAEPLRIHGPVGDARPRRARAAGPDRARTAPARLAEPVPPRVLGRAAPAHRHRPIPYRPTFASRLRRARLRSRCVGAVIDP